MVYPPLLQRPTYLSGAPIPGAVSSTVSDACGKVAEKAAPLASLVGASILGAVIAYYVPKAIEAISLNYGRYQEAGQSEHVDLDVTPRDD